MILWMHSVTYMLLAKVYILDPIIINDIYPQASDMGRTIVGSKIVDHSDVVGAAPELHLHSRPNTWHQCIAQSQLQDETRGI